MVRARILWNAIHQSRRSKCIPEKIVSSDWVQQRSLARTHHYRATHTAEGSSCGWYPYAKPETERRRPFHFWSEQYRADSRMDFLQSKSHSKSRLKHRSSEIYKQKRFSFCFLSFPFFLLLPMNFSFLLSMVWTQKANSKTRIGNIDRWCCTNTIEPIWSNRLSWLNVFCCTCVIFACIYIVPLWPVTLNRTFSPLL